MYLGFWFCFWRRESWRPSLAISWQAGPRSSSQTNGELSIMTNSPNAPRRWRHTCTCPTRQRHGRHCLAPTIHWRTRLPAHRQALLLDLLGGERRTKPSVARLMQLRSTRCCRATGIFGSTAARVAGEPTPVPSARTRSSKPPHVAVPAPQLLRPMPLFHVVQPADSTLRSSPIGPPSPHGEPDILLCTNRTSSLCSDTWRSRLDTRGVAGLRS